MKHVSTWRKTHREMKILTQLYKGTQNRKGGDAQLLFFSRTAQVGCFQTKKRHNEANMSAFRRVWRGVSAGVG